METIQALAPMIVITILVILSIINSYDTKRGLVIIAVLWSTVPGYFIFETDLYWWALDIFGDYGYQSLTPLLAICTLSFIRCKLSTVLMCLFSMLILANCWFWWLEGFGHEVYEAQQSIVWAVFVVEVVLMLSKRLTNGIHGGIFSDRLAANIPTHWMARFDSNLRIDSNLGSY